MATLAIPVPDSAPDTPPRRRHRIPLSLRLFVVMLIALGLIESLWIGIPAYRQRQSIISIEEEIGGSVGTQRAGPKWLQDFFGDDWNKLFGQPYEVHLFPDEGVDDAFFAQVSDLAGMERLDVDGTGMTDHALTHLASLSQLQVLEFGYSCGGTQVTNAGLPEILRLSNLRLLNLTGTRVTGSGLSCLIALRKLEYLELNGNQTIGANLAALKTANPSLAIVVDGIFVMSPDRSARPQDK